jgi:hypothetical protein
LTQAGNSLRQAIRYSKILSFETLSRLADVFEVSIDELTGRKNKAEKGRFYFF